MKHGYPKFSIDRCEWILLALLLLMPKVCGMELRNCDRSSLHPTKPTILELIGGDLRNAKEQPAQLWTSFPASVEVLDPESKDRGRVRYRITPTDPISGIVAIRAFNRDEVSQALMFFVAEEVTKGLPSDSAEPLDLPIAFDFQSQGLGERRIPISLQKGKRLVAEVLGNRIGSEVDGLLTLLDAAGRELAFADDNLVTGSDPVLEYVPTADGLHYLVVRDVEYRGGLRMHLRIDHQPIGGTVFPSALRIGETRRVETIPLESGDDSAAGFVSTGKRERSGFARKIANDRLVSIHQTAMPVYVEGQETVLPVPSVFCGRLSTGNAIDHVRFAAKKGTKLLFDSLNNGGPFVGHAQIFHDDSQVAEHHWGLDLNGRLKFTVPETDVYRLQVQDCLARTGVGMEYAFSIRDDLSSATLRLGNSGKRKKRRNERPHRLATEADEILELNIRIDRRGLNGPVKLRAWIDDVACKSIGEINAKKSDANWSIDIPNDVDILTLKHLTIRGFANDGTQEVEIPLDLSEHTSGDYPAMNPLPSLVNRIALVVAPSKKQEQ